MLFSFVIHIYPGTIFFRSSRTHFASKTRAYKTICDGIKPYRLYIYVCVCITTLWKSNGVGLNASLHHQSTNTTCFSVKLQCENQSSLHFFCLFLSFPIPHPFGFSLSILSTPSNSPHIHKIHASGLRKANLNGSNRTNAKPINFDCDIYSHSSNYNIAILPLPQMNVLTWCGTRKLFHFSSSFESVIVISN